MKAQLIYSVAALATFPIVVNAQVNADNIGKITAHQQIPVSIRRSLITCRGRNPHL